MDEYSKAIRAEIEKLEISMNIGSKLEEIDKASEKEWEKLKAMIHKLRKLEKELKKSKGGQPLPELQLECRNKMKEIEQKSNEIRQRMEKLDEERGELIKHLPIA